MEKRHTLTLDKEFILYCELNNIKDIISTIDINCNTTDCSITNINDTNLNTKIQKLMNSKIANNMPIACVNFLVKDFNTNFVIIEQITPEIKPDEEIISEEDKEKNNKLYIIISAAIIAIIIIITIIILVVRRNNYYDSMYPYGNMGYGSSMGYGGMGY